MLKKIGKFIVVSTLFAGCASVPDGKRRKNYNSEKV